MLKRWQGPPHINSIKQYYRNIQKLCCPLSSVCLFSSCIHEIEESLAEKKYINDDLSLLVNISDVAHL